MKEVGLNHSKLVLVVRLDQVVITPKSLLEAFWTAASASWLSTLKGLAQSTRGNGKLRACWERVAYLVPARLCYREDALEAVESWRATGGITVLVAEESQKAVSDVAAHLGLFDEAHGGVTFRTERSPHLDLLYGSAGYSMIATDALTTSDLASLDAQTYESDGVPKDLMASASPSIKPMIKLVRPHQWLKNSLVFVPILAAHELTPNALWQSLLAFFAFNMVASSTYVLNDLLDLNADRSHPRKRHRPLASGAVSLAHGTLLMPVLALAGLGAALFSGPPLLGALLAYFALTTVYSFRLKRLVMVDICTLALLYTMRILAGSVATGIPASMWLLAFSTFFFFSLAAVKRQAELVDGIAAGRVTAHGRGYHVDDLAIVNNIAVSAGMVSVLVLALYTNSEPVQLLYRTPEMLWGVCQGNRVSFSLGDEADKEVVVPCGDLTLEAHGVLGW